MCAAQFWQSYRCAVRPPCRCAASKSSEPFPGPQYRHAAHRPMKAFYRSFPQYKTQTTGFGAKVCPVFPRGKRIEGGHQGCRGGAHHGYVAVRILHTILLPTWSLGPDLLQMGMAATVSQTNSFCNVVVMKRGQQAIASHGWNYFWTVQCHIYIVTDKR